MNAPKNALRREAEASRRALHEAHPDAGLAMAGHFLSGFPLALGSVVSGFLPTRFEADPTPLMTDLRGRGHAIALPRVAAKEAPLRFHLWGEGAVPVPGAFGLLEPAADWPAVRPDIVLVPLLAFDEEGYRLGYGGGYYDRTLRELRSMQPTIAVGVAFSGQLRPDLPHDANDERLDWIVTETGLRRFAHASTSSA